MNNRKKSDLFSYYELMKFRTATSITKLVFLILTLVLSFQTVYLTLEWVETSLFNNAMLMVISFYFGQKVGKAQADPLIDNKIENDKD